MACFRNICHWRLRSKTWPNYLQKNCETLKMKEMVTTCCSWNFRPLHSSWNSEFMTHEFGSENLGEGGAYILIWAKSCQGVDWLNSCWKRVFLVRNSKVTWVTVSLKLPLRKVVKNLHFHDTVIVCVYVKKLSMSFQCGSYFSDNLSQI